MSRTLRLVFFALALSPAAARVAWADEDGRAGVADVG